MTLYTGGFSRFVASAAAPIATGWGDLAGHGERLQSQRWANFVIATDRNRCSGRSLPRRSRRLRHRCRRLHCKEHVSLPSPRPGRCFRIYLDRSHGTTLSDGLRSDNSIYSGLRHTKASAYVLLGMPVAVPERANRLYLLVIQLPLTPAQPPTCPRRCQPRDCALPDQLTLKLGERSKEMEDQAPSRRTGIKAFFQRNKENLTFLYPANNLQQVAQRTSEPIQPPHHQRVAFIETVKASL
jgi:hypothetical protein